MSTYEVIYLIYKKDFKLVPKANGHGDIWAITQEMKNKHPAPFSFSLVKKIISSTNARTVLDPFMGFGSTAIAAINLERNYIGIEISQEYVELANFRISNQIDKIYVGKKRRY